MLGEHPAKYIEPMSLCARSYNIAAELMHVQHWIIKLKKLLSACTMHSYAKVKLVENTEVL